MLDPLRQSEPSRLDSLIPTTPLDLCSCCSTFPELHNEFPFVSSLHPDLALHCFVSSLLHSLFIENGSLKMTKIDLLDLSILI